MTFYSTWHSLTRDILLTWHSPPCVILGGMTFSASQTAWHSLWCDNHFGLTLSWAWHSLQRNILSCSTFSSIRHFFQHGILFSIFYFAWHSLRRVYLLWSWQLLVCDMKCTTTIKTTKTTTTTSTTTNFEAMRRQQQQKICDIFTQTLVTHVGYSWEKHD